MEKCGMRWERDYICPQEWLPGWTEEQRRAVRYKVNAGDFFISRKASTQESH
jgi:hypothetical protein